MRSSSRCLMLAVTVLAGSAVGGFFPDAAAQQAYPNKAITIVVPAAAGGPTDTVTRLVAESMGRTLGAQIIIENIGGAGGTLGITRAAKAPADGYTLLLYHIGLATAASLYDNLRYDTLNDFDSIGRITDVPMTVVGKPNLAARNIAEVLAFVKEKQANAT